MSVADSRLAFRIASVIIEWRACTRAQFEQFHRDARVNRQTALLDQRIANAANWSGPTWIALADTDGRYHPEDGDYDCPMGLVSADPRRRT